MLPGVPYHVLARRRRPGRSCTRTRLQLRALPRPGRNHLDAVALKFSDPAIARPRLAPAERVNSLCGQCHAAVGRGLTADDPDLARFQASALP